MKNNLGIIICAALLIALSAIILCGCMGLIGDAPIESKEYDSGEMSDIQGVEQTPEQQLQMQKKFSAFGREETGENGEKIFYLFTEEQVNESLSLRAEGIRRSLTYDEILFIINDSIRMYFEYDKIILPIYLDLHLDKHHFQYIIPDSYNGSDTYELTPYKGDFSESEDAVGEYRQLLTDILYIISERIYIHDTATVKGGATNGSGLVTNYIDDIVLLDGGTITDYEECTAQASNVLRSVYKDYFPNLNNINSEHPMMLSTRAYDPFDGYKASLYYIEDGKRNLLFPTKELEALYPGTEIRLGQSLEEDVGTDKRIFLTFNRTNKTCTFNDIIGTYETNGNRITVTFPVNNTVTLERLSDGSFKVISANDSLGINGGEILYISFFYQIGS